MAEQGLGADRRSRRPRRRVWGGAFAARHRRIPGAFVAAAAAAIALAQLALPGPNASAAVSPPGGASAAPGAMRTVTYHGYEIDVPASWPVYNLAADPTRCVLFNQHAVYLGTPGTGQRCPARACAARRAVRPTATGDRGAAGQHRGAADRGAAARRVRTRLGRTHGPGG